MLEKEKMSDDQLLRWASFFDVYTFCLKNNVSVDLMGRKSVKKCMDEKYSMYKNLYNHGINVLDQIIN
jgi:hypothetical protein